MTATSLILISGFAYSLFASYQAYREAGKIWMLFYPLMDRQKIRHLFTDPATRENSIHGTLYWNRNAQDMNLLCLPGPVNCNGNTGNL